MAQCCHRIGTVRTVLQQATELPLIFGTARIELRREGEVLHHRSSSEAGSEVHLARPSKEGNRSYRNYGQDKFSRPAVEAYVHMSLSEAQKAGSDGRRKDHHGTVFNALVNRTGSQLSR